MTEPLLDKKSPKEAAATRTPIEMASPIFTVEDIFGIVSSCELK